MSARGWVCQHVAARFELPQPAAACRSLPQPAAACRSLLQPAAACRSLCSLCSLPQPATAWPQDAATPSVDCENTSYGVFSPFFLRDILRDFAFLGQNFATSTPQREHFSGSAANFTQKTGKNVQKRPKIPQMLQPAAACRSLPQPDAASAASAACRSLPQPATACNCTLINTPYPPRGDNQPTYFRLSGRDLRRGKSGKACRSVHKWATY